MKESPPNKLKRILERYRCGGYIYVLPMDEMAYIDIEVASKAISELENNNEYTKESGNNV